MLAPRRPGRKRAAWLAFGALALFVAALLGDLAGARAATPEHYEVSARADRAQRRVEGTARVRVRVLRGESRVRLWLYPERMREPPSAMDERAWRWIYPGEVSRGGITLSAMTVDGAPAEAVREQHAPGHPRGVDVAGADLLVPIEAGEARTVVLSFAFTLEVAGRFGRLGFDDGVMSLAAPWYPLVVGADDAFDHGATHAVRLESRDGAVTLLDRSVGRAGQVEARVAYVPAVVAPAMHRVEVEAGGVSIVLRSADAMYQPPSAEVRGAEGLIDLSRVDVASYVREVAAEVFASARAFGIPLPARVVMLQVRSRTELVATAPGVVLFSDHLFQIFPIDQTLDFHRRALRRGLMAHLAEQLSAVDAPPDRGWAADVRAVALVDLDQARRNSGAQTPQELLSLVSFHPAVDQLLYAPQIAFEDAYFATIEERDPYRDDPARSGVR